MFVQREKNPASPAFGKVKGVFRRPQYEGETLITEPVELADDHADLVEYLQGDIETIRAKAVADIEDRNARLFALIYPVPGIVQEYQQAEAQARAFALADYAGAVPPYVQNRMDATGRTAQQAADDILARAAAAATVLPLLSRARQLARSAITSAADAGAIEAARQAGAAAFEQIREAFGS